MFNKTIKTMKSIKSFALMGAVALIGSVGFTSCENNNNPENKSGKYNGETVKTEFLIKLIGSETDNSSVRHMPAATAQIDGTFRGMDSIRLIPLRSAGVDDRAGKTITLPRFTNTEMGTNSKAKVYENVSIPIGTKEFLFYGKAYDVEVPGTLSNYSDAQLHQYGRVNCSSAKNVYSDNDVTPSELTFDLQQIYSTTGTPSEASALATFVSNVACAKIGDAAPYTYWKDYSANEGIQQMFTTFTALTSGSSNAILSTVTDLYNTLEKFQAMQVSADPMATAIMNAIKANTTGYDAGTEGARVLALSGLQNNYPLNINLPEGAARIAWNSTNNVFDVVNAAVMGSGSHDFGTLNQYVYPASLQYYGKSTIQTSTESERNEYNNTNDWATILGKYDDGVTVLSSTKSVAIKDPINYGVGQLKVTVKKATADLLDSKNNTMTAHAIGWKGVLVGDQKQVNYQFEQVSPAPATSYTIYDNYLNTTPGINQEIALTTEFSEPNYTLVFSSADNDAPYSDKIHIALELVNNGDPFYGVSGQYIPHGATFYLVGVLDAAAATGVNKNNHAPHYNIFFKDYTTEAKFIIGSLANAYYTIPDLRSDKLELGFSVDLTWESGMVFEVTL